MLREAVATGETVELAQEAACKELGVETYEAEFEILAMPVRKTFGLFGGNPAKVRAFIKTGPAQAAADYLRDVLSQMGLSDVKMEITEQEEGALIALSGENIGFIIGHRGETLDSLQYLAGLVSNHVDNSYYRITLDIGNYRGKRQETLDSLGSKIAEKAIRTGRNCPLEPMNPYERRIIHTAVQEIEGAKSWSEGEGIARHVVIGPEGGERFAPRRPAYNDRRGGTGTPRTGTAAGIQRPYAPRPNTNTKPQGAPTRPATPATSKASATPAVPATPTVPATPAVPVTPMSQPTPVTPKAYDQVKSETKGVLYGRIDVKK